MTHNMIKNILLLIAAAFLLVACSNDHKMNKGIVVAKNRVETRVFVRYDATMQRVRTVVYPASNYVWIADSVRVEQYCVDDTTFQKLIIGQEYKVKK